MRHSSQNWFLKPFSGLYGLGTDIRNWLFDNHLKPVYTPAVRTVSVGNLTVGGTGKTPMVEFLIQWYKREGLISSRQIVTLSRGYGRRTTGFRVADDTDTAATIGDEPLQLYRKFGNQVRVCVGERRAEAIRLIMQQVPDTRLILLDDAFQHRFVRPAVNLLLTDFNRPFYTDYPFPAGRLRERRHGARRADAVIVTKCPANLPKANQEQVTTAIRRFARPDAPVFFAGLAYDRPVSFADQRPVDWTGDVVLLSGLANPEPLERYVRQVFTLLSHHRFPDHYAYTRTDLEPLVKKLPPGARLLTTEKDWVKLDALLSPADRAQWPLAYLPVRLQPLPDSAGALERFLQAEILKKL